MVEGIFPVTLFLFLVLLTPLLPKSKLFSKTSMSVRGNRKKYDRFNNADDALTLFNNVIEKYPKPWIMEFTKLLAAIVRMKHYAVVVSMYRQMELLGVFHNVYSSNILINSFCQLNQIDSGFSVLGKMLKLGVEPDA
ncbi:hypothetical protein Gotur_015894, partial [Gossypium turneri]